MMESMSNRAFDKTYKNYAFAWRGKKYFSETGI